jgi:hypothetical protein
MNLLALPAEVLCNIISHIQIWHAYVNATCPILRDVVRSYMSRPSDVDKCEQMFHPVAAAIIDGSLYLVKWATQYYPTCSMEQNRVKYVKWVAQMAPPQNLRSLMEHFDGNLTNQQRAELFGASIVGFLALRKDGLLEDVFWAVSRGYRRETVLQCITWRQDLALIKSLIDEGYPNGLMLEYAVLHNLETIVKYLLDERIVTETCSQGLMVACKTKNASLFAYMCAMTNARTVYIGNVAVKIAREAIDEIFDMYLVIGSYVTVEVMNAAAEYTDAVPMPSGDETQPCTSFARIMKLSTICRKSPTAETIASAAKAGNAECIRRLRKHGCDWNETALISAAKAGQVKCLGWLIHQGCPLTDPSKILELVEAMPAVNLQCLRLVLGLVPPEKGELAQSWVKRAISLARWRTAHVILETIPKSWSRKTLRMVSQKYPEMTRWMLRHAAKHTLPWKCKDVTKELYEWAVTNLPGEATCMAAAKSGRIVDSMKLHQTGACKASHEKVRVKIEMKQYLDLMKIGSD